jgi:hypothetical protein
MNDGYLSHARRVADAVLYEGYLRYPYRGGARKNRARFQFGVLMPPAYRAVDPGELSAAQTECLLECTDDAQVRVQVRFLQLQRRTVETAGPAGEVAVLDPDSPAWPAQAYGADLAPWDEAIEREQETAAPVAALLGGREVAFHIGRGQASAALPGPDGPSAGWTLRRWAALRGRITLHARRVAGPYRALRLQARVENHTAAGPLRNRQDALPHALIAAHVLVAVSAGRFLSMVDPPEWAAAEVAACTNIGTWPVLAGPEGCRHLMFSSPVILCDHPEIAAESTGDPYDATEID